MNNTQHTPDAIWKELVGLKRGCEMSLSNSRDSYRNASSADLREALQNDCHQTENWLQRFSNVTYDMGKEIQDCNNDVVGSFSKTNKLFSQNFLEGCYLDLCIIAVKQVELRYWLSVFTRQHNQAKKYRLKSITQRMKLCIGEVTISYKRYTQIAVQLLSD